MNTILNITDSLTAMGRTALIPVYRLGSMTLFSLKAFFHIFSYPIQIYKVSEQIHFIGMKSVFVICLTGSFTGLVLGLQLYNVLVKFGTEGLIGAAVGLTLVLEMGPVFSAIMVIGRAGSAMAAEIGVMRISEQIDALETMDIDPIRYLISPRLAASIISFPLLTALFDCLGIIGGYLTSCLLLGVDKAVYFVRLESAVTFHDVKAGFIKSIVFGALVAIICCYQGYYTHMRKEGFGAKGVSLSTTSAVVICCVTILIVNYILTSFLIQ